MKKAFSLFLALLLCVALSTAAFAADPTIRVESGEAEAGDTIELTVSLENNPGIMAFDLEVDYDTSRLEQVDIGHSGLGGMWSVGDSIVWLAMSEKDYNGEFLQLKFRVLDDAPDGDAYVTISYGEGDICNYNEEAVNFAVVSGGVTVSGGGEAPAETDAPTETDAPAATDAPAGTDAPAATKAPSDSGNGGGTTDSGSRSGDDDDELSGVVVATTGPDGEEIYVPAEMLLEDVTFHADTLLEDKPAEEEEAKDLSEVLKGTPEPEAVSDAPQDPHPTADEQKNEGNPVLVLIVVLAVAALALIAVLVVLLSKKSGYKGRH